MQTYYEKQQFKILAVFLPILVADTKITFVYNFVARLRIITKYFRFTLQASKKNCFFFFNKKKVAVVQ